MPARTITSAAGFSDHASGLAQLSLSVKSGAVLSPHSNVRPAGSINARLADRAGRSDRPPQTRGRTSRQFGRVSSAGSRCFAGGRCMQVFAASQNSVCGPLPLYVPQGSRVESAEAGPVPEAIPPLVDEGGGAEQEPAFLWLHSRSSRVLASNSPRVG